MTHLRQAMLEELQRRNYAKTTVLLLPQGRRAIRPVLSHVPGSTEPERQYQADLLRERHLVEAGADLRTVQLLLGHVKLEHTVIYLHLSQRHLQVGNPLDAMPVSGADTVRRTRRLHKR